MKNLGNIRLFGLLSLCCFVLTMCRKNEPEPEITVIGVINADLNATENIVRKKEALIGDFVTDGLSNTMKLKGYVFDFCVINSGSIRFNKQDRPSGIYSSGSITSSEINEMLPFGDVPVLVTLTGAELKQFLERSVAQYPLAKGPFLQISKELRILIDTLGSEQQLNTTETSIISSGNRIVSIEINGISYDPITEYKVLTINFLAQGDDGYVTFKNIPASKKEVLIDYISGYIAEYVILNTPINVVLDGRIKFQ